MGNSLWSFSWDQLWGQAFSFEPIIPQEEKRYAPSQKEVFLVGAPHFHFAERVT